MKDRQTITTTTIRLPKVRADQLRAIAAAHGRSLVEQIEAWIHAEIEAGIIGPDLPGIDLAPASAPRVINLDAMKPPAGGSTMTMREMLANPDSPEAQAFATKTREGARSYLQRSYLQRWQDAVAEPARRGTGYVVTAPDGSKHVMSESILRDLRAQVERAAKAA